MKILIAEDEVSIARALKVALEKNKYAVDMVHNGKDALQYISSTHYDALVLDIMMPEMDGIEVLKRARMQGIHTPALFLTAKSSVEDRVAGLDAGADDYLPKPFAMSEFLARVRALVRRSDSYASVVLTVGNVSLNCSSYMLSARDNEIRQQSGYLSRLIQNLITLSRLDEENLFPEKSEFSLSDAVWEIAEPFSSLAKARHKEYTQHIEDGLVLVGDRAAIQQMVSILLDNAMKYSEDNGRISLLVQKSSGKVEIEVFNTCKKEEGADISRIFERFYRMDESHSGRVKGTGIGLSIAKATAEAHGGSIRASYRKDGILFRVVL